jgi:hypothetical protein
MEGVYRTKPLEPRIKISINFKREEDYFISARNELLKLFLDYMRVLSLPDAVKRKEKNYCEPMFAVALLFHVFMLVVRLW